MPTYEYRCGSCGQDLEVVQSFNDAAMTQCPNCEDGQLRKKFGNVGVVFKGSGFYRNDARAEEKKKASSRAAGEKSTSDTASKDSSNDAGGGKADKPVDASKPTETKTSDSAKTTTKTESVKPAATPTKDSSPAT